MSRLLFAAAIVAVLHWLVLALRPAMAQPAPSFEAECGGLRAALEKLGWKGGETVTIAVKGRLTAVRSDRALAYLFMCEAPAPRVLCVTYQTNGSAEGDEVVLTGNYIPRGPDHIQLDPCLHHPAQ